MRVRAIAGGVQLLGVILVGVALSVVGWWASTLWAGAVLFAAGVQLERVAPQAGESEG